MADFLSLHWGERVVGVEASVSGGSIRVRTTFSADRSTATAATTADESSDSDAEVSNDADWLSSAVSAAGVSARQAFVVLSQQDVVTRWLELPAVSDEELPDVVRWQAGTKSTLSVDQLIVDFLPLPVAEGAETRSVLLATVARETVDEIGRELSAAGLELRGVGVGSLALTDLGLRLAGGHDTSDGLVIAADGNQLEVTVHQQGLTILTHSASLSGESDPVRTAGQAISRALFAADNSVTDLKLESAVLLGSLGADLAEVVRGRLVQGEGEGEPRVDVVSLSDTPIVSFRKAPEEDLAGSPALAAAVGGLLTAAGEVSERIDFLDPHRPPPPQRRVSNQMMVRVAAGVLLLVGLVYAVRVMGSRGLEADIAKLEAQIAREKKSFYGSQDTASRGKLPSTSTVDRWQAARVQWLDQLHELSPLIGESDELILTEVDLSQDVRKGLGRITVTGLTNDPDPVTRVTSRIRDHKNYNVRPSKFDQNKDRQAEYKWRFSKVNILLQGKAPAPRNSDADDTRAAQAAQQVDTGKAGS
jgi:hypothetical protein